MLKVNNFEELEKLGEKVWETSVSLFFQEFIPGDSDCVFFVGGYFSKHEHDESLFVGRKTLEMPLLGGSTTYAHLQWNEDVLEAAKNTIKSIGYEGLADIEFKYDYRDKKYKIIEVNPRIGRWHTISTCGDIDIISLYFLKLSGAVVPNINLHREGQRWISPYLSFCGFIEKNGLFIGMAKWLFAMYKAEIKVDTNIRSFRYNFNQLRVVLGHMRQIGLKKTMFGS